MQNPSATTRAGTKNTALFDIVNRKQTPIGIGVEPMGGRARARSAATRGERILAKRTHVAEMQQGVGASPLGRARLTVNCTPWLRHEN